ncbi:hypothetical protein [uncultured Enterococcus sp.]|uniref:hypothetical protein n=1 Tax=uncultured Enterococcus sp. TaxID=167972 RepID=UPI002AA7D0E5|nr:hypothetical protein [uncultured Enterococcus sp.]
MPNTYYDEFKNLKLTKMADSISNMTYNYNETVVPKKHYEQQLSVRIEEMLEASVEMNFVNTFVGMLKQLREQNEKMFFQALLCLDMKVNVTNITSQQHHALEETWALFSSGKNKKYMDLDMLAKYQEIVKQK